MRTVPASNKAVLQPQSASLPWIPAGVQFSTNHYKIYACLGTPASAATVDHNHVLALRALADLRSFHRITIVLPILLLISAMSRQSDVYRRAALLWELKQKHKSQKQLFRTFCCCRVLGESLIILRLCLEHPLENQVHTQPFLCSSFRPAQNGDLGFCRLVC